MVFIYLYTLVVSPVRYSEVDSSFTVLVLLGLNAMGVLYLLGRRLRTIKITRMLLVILEFE